LQRDRHLKLLRQPELIARMLPSIRRLQFIDSKHLGAIVLQDADVPGFHALANAPYLTEFVFVVHELKAPPESVFNMVFDALESITAPLQTLHLEVYSSSAAVESVCVLPTVAWLTKQLKSLVKLEIQADWHSDSLDDWEYSFASAPLLSTLSITGIRLYDLPSSLWTQLGSLPSLTDVRVEAYTSRDFQHDVLSQWQKDLAEFQQPQRLWQTLHVAIFPMHDDDVLPPQECLVVDRRSQSLEYSCTRLNLSTDTFAPLLDSIQPLPASWKSLKLSCVDPPNWRPPAGQIRSFARLTKFFELPSVPPPAISIDCSGVFACVTGVGGPSFRWY
jgi:hypothetical protein